MAATAQDLQRLLEDAWQDREADARTLREQLRFQERSVGELLATGSINSVSKNSASQTYSFSGNGTLTTVELARAFRDLITLHDTVAQLFSLTADADIYAEMMARCVPIYSSRPDMRFLHCTP